MGNYFSSVELKFLFYALPFGIGFIGCDLLSGLIIGERAYPLRGLIGIVSLFFFLWGFLRVKYRDEIFDRTAKVSKLIDLLAYIAYFQFVAFLLYNVYRFMY